MANGDQGKNTIKIINDPAIKRVYSNFVAVTTTPHECNITFCQIDPLEIQKDILPARAIAKVAIPLSLVEETLKAIETNYKNFIKQRETHK